MIEKLNFHLRFKTSFGQAIFITGNHPLLGNGKIEQAVPMVYLNDDYWVKHIELENINQATDIVYHYYIQNADGTRIFDTGNDKYIKGSSIHTAELVLLDSWNFTGYKENAFYTAPFANV